VIRRPAPLGYRELEGEVAYRSPVGDRAPAEGDVDANSGAAVVGSWQFS